jgi:hypothetical protein
VTSERVVRIPVEVPEDAVVFDVVARGYDRRQVDEHVATLEQELAELRWEAEDVAARRAELADARAAFDRERAEWEPSWTLLGARAREILQLAVEEAAQVRADAVAGTAALHRQAEADLEQARREAAHEAQALRARAARDLEVFEDEARLRRELLERDLAHARRDAELEATGLVATATARADELVETARRAAAELQAAAAAELTHTARSRDALAQELVDLSERLVAVVSRLGVERPDADRPAQTAVAGRLTPL